MITKLGTLLKRIVFAFGIIYGVDVVLRKAGIYVPINFITISTTTFLGVPGLISLIILSFIL